MSMSIAAVSTFSSLGQYGRYGNGRPNPYRFGRYQFARPLHSDSNWSVCQLSRKHVASVTVAVAVIALLLIISAYHGGEQHRSSWLYSLILVISGLAFVVFVSLLLCRVLMHALYRQVQSQSVAEVRITSATQTSSQRRASQRPAHLYACILIAPDDGVVRGGEDLPSYEEAIGSPVPPMAEEREEKSESPPPSYNEALVILAHGQNQEEE